MIFRADAKKRYSALWDRELRAGEKLRLAGYRPARAWGRTGVWRRAMRFCCRVLRLVHACRSAFLLECFAFDHACLFSFVRKRETACGMLRFLFRRGS